MRSDFLEAVAEEPEVVEALRQASQQFALTGHVVEEKQEHEFGQDDGIDAFVAIINPPHSAILAIGAVAAKPVVRDGELVIRQMMSVTLSGDHRVIDGAVGAQYLQVLKGILEHPMRMLF